jgi:catechol 2,3-dioxygenase-like lactoylglutathione lyase family enzyme
MKLEFLFAPTSDLEGSLALYRDTFGCTEVWREGDKTVSLTLPGTSTQLMLDANDPDAPSGMLFVADSVKAFHAARPDTLKVLADVAEIPGGFIATYQDPGGVVFYVMDQSTDASGA